MMKDGFYWARFKDEDESMIVEVRGDNVGTIGVEDDYDMEFFTEIAVFLSKEPLEVSR